MFALLELERDGTEQYNRNNNTTDLKNKDCRFRRVADLVVFGWVCLFFLRLSISLGVVLVAVAAVYSVTRHV